MATNKQAYDDAKEIADLENRVGSNLASLHANIAELKAFRDTIKADGSRKGQVTALMNSLYTDYSWSDFDDRADELSELDSCLLSNGHLT